MKKTKLHAYYVLKHKIHPNLEYLGRYFYMEVSKIRSTSLCLIVSAIISIENKSLRLQKWQLLNCLLSQSKENSIGFEFPNGLFVFVENK